MKTLIHLRLEYTGVIYHITSRGDRRKSAAHVSRCIHRNPLEAGMVRKLESYTWSSYPSYLRQTTKPDWLTINSVLSLFCRRSARYQAYVEAGTDAETTQFYDRQRLSPIMGSKLFKDRLLETTEYDVVETPESRRVTTEVSVADIEQWVCNAYGVKNRQLYDSIRGQKNEPRLVAMYLARKLGGMTYPEIAAHFNLGHYKSATSAITRVQQYEELLRKAERFRRRLNEIL